MSKSNNNLIFLVITIVGPRYVTTPNTTISTFHHHKHPQPPFQHWNISTEAGADWIGQGSCHGSSNVSGMSGISITRPLTSEAIWSTELSDLRRSVSSAIWALSTLLLDAAFKCSWVVASIIWLSFLFSSFIRPSSSSSSSKRCCFFIRDLRADSRLESFLFLFLSSPSEPGLVGNCFEAIPQNVIDRAIRLFTIK